MDWHYRHFQRDRERAGLTIEALSAESGLSVKILEKIEDKRRWDGTERPVVAMLDEAYARLEAQDRERFNAIAAKIVGSGLAMSVQPLAVNSTRGKHYRVEIGSEELATSGVGTTAVGHGWTPYVALVNAQTQLDAFDADVKLAFKGLEKYPAPADTDKQAA